MLALDASDNRPIASARTFPVVERFVSINGEGLQSGRVAAFIRFAICNLKCNWCDTRWANDQATADAAEKFSIDEILNWVHQTGVSAVTLTGGEPLLQAGLADLVQALLRVNDPHPLRVEIETNGSRDISAMHALRTECEKAGAPGSLHFTLDWKTPGAGKAACDSMDLTNHALLDDRDAVKFVVASRTDLEFAKRSADDAKLWDRCQVLLSPVWENIEPSEIVDFMVAHHMDRARLQLQMHKIIWPDVNKGV